MSLRVVFAGTPGFSVPCLQALLQLPAVDVVGVVSQPDRRSGRGMRLNPSPVKQAALDVGIEVITPERLRDNSEALAWLQDRQADLLVVVAFGMILPKAWLDAVSIAAVNVHASLLPRWRGAAPIERSLLAGDAETGVCIMQMEEGLDTGGIYTYRKLPITAQTTGAELWSALSEMGAALLAETVPQIAAGLQPVPQSDDGVTYAAKINSDERNIDWGNSAQEIDRLVRCFSPRPGARSRCQGRWLKVLAGRAVVWRDGAGRDGPIPGTILAADDLLTIACGDASAYRISQLQPEGKRAMPAADFIRGARIRAGDMLSDDG